MYISLIILLTSILAVVSEGWHPESGLEISVKLYLIYRADNTNQIAFTLKLEVCTFFKNKNVC